jgi:carbon starvation protein
LPERPEGCFAQKVPDPFFRLYLWRRNKPVWFLVLPMVLMIVMPAWALAWQMFNSESGWLTTQNYVLLAVGAATLVLQAWMVIEALWMWPRSRGVLEEALPPLARGPDIAADRIV